MGFLYFSINSQACSQITRYFSNILHLLKLLILHLGLFKSPVEIDQPPERPSSFVFLTEGPCPSLVTVPANDLTAMIKKKLLVIEYGDFLGEMELKSEENGRCMICLSDMEKWEKMRELKNCCHVFHRECLDTWIDEFQITCPICRSILLPRNDGDGIRYVH